MITRVKAAYHRLVPDRIRFPLGAGRRRLDDLWLRLTAAKPLPPRHLLAAVQMTPRQREYLDGGRRCASSLRRQLAERGIEAGHLLDFGCGLGRTLRHFESHSEEELQGWHLHGCDVDARLIDWCRGALPGVDWRVNGPCPPLPYEDGRFDALWSISVFTHFGEEDQRLWAADVSRVLQPGGLALISLMGPHALGAFPALHGDGRAALDRCGFFFQVGGQAFNERGAFHTADGVRRLFEPHLQLEQWIEGGLDGFQDLAVLRAPAE